MSTRRELANATMSVEITADDLIEAVDQISHDPEDIVEFVKRLCDNKQEWEIDEALYKHFSEQMDRMKLEDL